MLKQVKKVLSKHLKALTLQKTDPLHPLTQVLKKASRSCPAPDPELIHPADNSTASDNTAPLLSSEQQALQGDQKDSKPQPLGGGLPTNPARPLAPPEVTPILALFAEAEQLANHDKKDTQQVLKNYAQQQKKTTVSNQGHQGSIFDRKAQ